MRNVYRILLASLIVLSGIAVSAQEKIPITVKSSEVNNGVVILEVMKGGKSVELQCNQGAPNCNALKAGKYQLVELGPNSGLYECKDVQIFADSPTAATADANQKPGEAMQKIGEYCLTEK